MRSVDLSRKERGFPPVAINFHDAEESSDAGNNGSTPPIAAGPRQFRFPETPPPKFGAARNRGGNEDGNNADSVKSEETSDGIVLNSTPSLSIVDVSSRDNEDGKNAAENGVFDPTGVSSTDDPSQTNNGIQKMALPVFSFDTFEFQSQNKTNEYSRDKSDVSSNDTEPKERVEQHCVTPGVTRVNAPALSIDGFVEDPTMPSPVVGRDLGDDVLVEDIEVQSILLGKQGEITNTSQNEGSADMPVAFR